MKEHKQIFILPCIYDSLWQTSASVGHSKAFFFFYTLNKAFTRAEPWVYLMGQRKETQVRVKKKKKVKERKMKQRKKIQCSLESAIASEKHALLWITTTPLARSWKHFFFFIIWRQAKIMNCYWCGGNLLKNILKRQWNKLFKVTVK